jgi:hypothetical protein
MPKALCITGMVVAILVLSLFVVDLAIAFPFKRASPLMDIVFVLCAAALGYMSWTTLKEQS